jgi:hypothetical protein
MFDLGFGLNPQSAPGFKCDFAAASRLEPEFALYLINERPTADGSE